VRLGCRGLGSRWCDGDAVLSTESEERGVLEQLYRIPGKQEGFGAIKAAMEVC